MLQRANDTTSLIIKIMLILAIAVIVLYLGVSVYGNIVMGGTGDDNGLPAYPSVSKAQYAVTLTTTGELLFVKEYDNPSEGIYILKSYYTVKDGRWEFVDRELALNEYYFGEIEVIRRVE